MLETIAIRTVFGSIKEFLKSIPREVWYILAAALLLWWVDSRAYDRGYSNRTAEYEEQARIAQENARRADDAASTQREQDNRQNQENEDARNEAIERDGRTGLNCERLRRAGYGEADLPEPCRR